MTTNTTYKRAIILLLEIRSFKNTTEKTQSNWQDIVRYKEDYNKAIKKHIERLNKESKYCKYELIKIIAVDCGFRDITARNY